MNSSTDHLARLIKESLIQDKASNKTRERPFGFYWTRKNPAIASNLIEKISQSESIVLDPFLGSGSTFFEIAKKPKNRLFVGVELNELPLRNLIFSLGDVPLDYRAQLMEISSMLDKLSLLYTFETQVGSIELTKIIHNKIEGALIPQIFEFRIKTNSKIEKAFAKSELFDEIRELYNDKLRKFPERLNLTLEANSRIAVHAGMRVSDVFGPYGFESLSMCKTQGSKNDLCRLLVASSIHLVRLTDAKSQSQFPYWHPKIDIHEKSAALVLRRQLDRMQKYLPKHQTFMSATRIGSYELWKNDSNQTFLPLHGPVSKVLDGAIPDNSVDLVITDPPYFDQVAYSEYLKLWEFFTEHEANIEDEIVESSRSGGNKTRDRFLSDLEYSFNVIRRKMKDDSFALIYFKDSKPRNLHDFIECLEKAGLHYRAQVHLPNQKFTYKQNLSKENTVGGDSIMIFQAGEVLNRTFVLPRSFKGSHEDYFLELFRIYIQCHGPSSLSEALDESLISDLYPTGFLKAIKSNSRLFQIVSDEFEFDRESRKWSLKTHD